jgi:excisionase family DNA binding protein
MKSNESLLTVKDVSEILKVSQFTVKRWTRLNMIPHVRLPRHLRFRREDVERFLSLRSRSAAA